MCSSFISRTWRWLDFYFCDWIQLKIEIHQQIHQRWWQAQYGDGDAKDGADDGFWNSHHSRCMATVPRGPTNIHHILNNWWVNYILDFWNSDMKSLDIRGIFLVQGGNTGLQKHRSSTVINQDLLIIVLAVSGYFCIMPYPQNRDSDNHLIVKMSKS